MRSLRRARRPLLALIALVVALVVGYAVQAGDSHDPAPSSSTSAGASGSAASGPSGSGGSSARSASASVPLSSLPPQAGDTVRLVLAGGPFPYPRNDGVVFHNYGHVLPAEPDGYYREYTVPTPGSPDRGARRLVTGRAGEFFYTGDHYDTFRRVDVSR